jgi:thiol:disulfide interchange protein
MNRRDFLMLSAAVTLAAPTAARAAGGTPYTPGAVDRALAEGKTVFLDFTASWCSTCRAQARVIEALRAEEPAYAALTFIDVDWDTYSGAEITRRLNVPRRSTLIALRGDREIGRIVAGTGRDEIKALMDAALAAAAP